MTAALLDRPTADITRREVILGGLSLAALTAAGCGDDGPSEDAAITATRDVRDVFGPITVPRDPRRVVALDDQVLGNLLRLGFPQERIVGWARNDTPLERYGYLAEWGDLAAIPDIGGAFDDPNIEAIVAADPDLLMMVAEAGVDFYTPIFDKLRETGIPVFGAFNGYLSVDQYMQLLRDVGVAVGLESKAKELEDDYRARVADLSTRLEASGPLPTATFVRVIPGDGMIFNNLMPILDAVGVPGDRPGPEEFYRELSAEQIEQLDHDVLFVGDG
ncbi:MAG TPA: ABC transporter substrate-binding protein, partial [Acidimicrobiales bacterium]|nr:ABC transporter substrate-binding protein [Acidimicrobiales bacterium]